MKTQPSFETAVDDRYQVAIEMESAGIDPATSRMLSERSTIWASSPVGSRWNYIKRITILSFLFARKK